MASMSDADNDRKRKAVEIDAAAVAPKKKLAAQAALAAAEAAGREAGAGKAGGVVKLESTKAPSYSVEETAPSGANAADSEEVLKFQNERIYAALEVMVQLTVCVSVSVAACMADRDCFAGQKARGSEA